MRGVVDRVLLASGDVAIARVGLLLQYVLRMRICKEEKWKSAYYIN